MTHCKHSFPLQGLIMTHCRVLFQGLIMTIITDHYYIIITIITLFQGLIMAHCKHSFPLRVCLGSGWQWQLVANIGGVPLWVPWVPWVPQSHQTAPHGEPIHWHGTCKCGNSSSFFIFFLFLFFYLAYIFFFFFLRDNCQYILFLIIASYLQLIAAESAYFVSKKNYI